MEMISLRTYDKEIDKLIENGHVDEAIAHCQYILRTFPKHVETYRLLGKAYLENQKYSEAMDIFQRVLSSVPDDFFSHVGMSIVHEDKGNLDEAIWHMERAFEVQPANNAIQSELKRLYGRRDGFEPPRIRLTRGALARMYYRGDLYQQAIAEIRAALTEDPTRLDLQLLLATVFQKSNQVDDAIETANNVLQKLPFCMQANLIINQIFIQTNRIEEAQPYYLKLESLDPYFGYTTPTNQVADQVPDNTISIEKLAWTPPTPEATTIGETERMPLPQAESSERPDEQMAEEERPILPEWLRSTVEISEISPQEEITQWLKAASWITATETVYEAIGEGDESALPEIQNKELTEDKIAQAEIPDWLLEIAPTTEALDAKQDIAVELGTMAAIDKIITEHNEAETAETLETSAAEGEPTTEELALSLPTTEEPIAEQVPSDIATQWLPESELGQISTSVEADESDAFPDLIEEDTASALLKSQAIKQAADQTLPLSPEEQLETPPEWIQEDTQTGENNSTQLPDWLKELTAEESVVTGEVVAPDESSLEATDLSEEGAPSPESLTAEEPPELPSWLAGELEEKELEWTPPPNKLIEQPVVTTGDQETAKTDISDMTFSVDDKDLPQEIVEARNDFQQGKLGDAQTKYSQLVKSQKYLSTIIKDLEEIVKKHPEDVNSWQNLGDAYLRNHQVKEAMEAYTQAEKLLR